MILLIVDFVWVCGCLVVFFFKQHKTLVNLCLLVMDSVFYMTRLLVLKQEVEAPYETII